MLIHAYNKQMRRLIRISTYITSVIISVTALIKAFQFVKAYSDLYSVLPEKFVGHVFDIAADTIKYFALMILINYVWMYLVQRVILRENFFGLLESAVVSFVPAINLMILQQIHIKSFYLITLACIISSIPSILYVMKTANTVINDDK